jgi:CBS domain-containing protein
MENSEKFLCAFVSIEKHLKKLCNFDTWKNFSHAVDEASVKHPEVRRFKDDLKEFAELRNAIVHDQGGMGMYVIAEPNSKAVTDIEHILDVITNPPKVIPTFQVDVLTFDINTPIAEAIESMAKKDISQVPITAKDNFKALLTNDTITRWLGLNVKEDIFCLSECAIGKVLEYAESADNFKFISKTSTLFETMETFHVFENQGKKLDAALITETGKESEKIIGIVTVADFPKMIQKLSFRQ